MRQILAIFFILTSSSMAQYWGDVWTDPSKLRSTAGTTWIDHGLYTNNTITVSDPDRFSFDSLTALEERFQAVTPLSRQQRGGAPLPSTRGSDVDLLIQAKDKFIRVANNYVDIRGYRESNLLSDVRNGLAIKKITNMQEVLIRNNMPTNFFVFTPTRALDGFGAPIGSDRDSNVIAGFSYKDYSWSGLRLLITSELTHIMSAGTVTSIVKTTTKTYNTGAFGLIEKEVANSTRGWSYAFTKDGQRTPSPSWLAEWGYGLGTGFEVGPFGPVYYSDRYSFSSTYSPKDGFDDSSCYPEDNGLVQEWVSGGGYVGLNGTRLTDSSVSINAGMVVNDYKRGGYAFSKIIVYGPSYQDVYGFARGYTNNTFIQGTATVRSGSGPDEEVPWQVYEDQNGNPYTWSYNGYSWTNTYGLSTNLHILYSSSSGPDVIVPFGASMVSEKIKKHFSHSTGKVFNGPYDDYWCIRTVMNSEDHDGWVFETQYMDGLVWVVIIKPDFDYD